MTFKVLVVLPFCAALLIQGSVCVAVLAGGNIFGQMEQDAYDLFSERVSSQAGFLENDMVFRWSDLDAVSQVIGSDINSVLASSGVPTEDISMGSPLAVSLLDAAADDMVSFARSAQVDGVFLVLANGEQFQGGAGVHSALYLWDSSPQINVAGDADLMLATCPLSVGKRLGIALDSQWSATFPLAAEGNAESAFYYEPLRAAERYPLADTADLGYWGHPVNFGWSGTSSVTYSVPIRDSSGVVRAVLGVSVRVDRLASYFPYEDLSATGDGSYVLAVTDEKGGFTRDGGVTPLAALPRSYDVLATTGATQSLYIQDESFQATLNEQGLMSVDLTPEAVAGDAHAIASATEVTLYDSTSPRIFFLPRFLGVAPTTSNAVAAFFT